MLRHPQRLVNFSASFLTKFRLISNRPPTCPLLHVQKDSSLSRRHISTNQPFLWCSTKISEEKVPKGDEEVAEGDALGGTENGDEENVQPAKEVAAPPMERGKFRATVKDRSKVVPLEVSMRYLKSNAYKETYGDNHVWVLYRRNFKGQFAPKKTRKTCIRKEELASGNPCPICRDEYLVLDYRNVDLLNQFISPFNGEILSYQKTGLCQKRHSELVVEILKARDMGTITFDVPFREYDYSEYQHLYDSYKASS